MAFGTQTGFPGGGVRSEAGGVSRTERDSLDRTVQKLPRNCQVLGFSDESPIPDA